MAYITVQDVYTEYGEGNVKKWLTLERDGTGNIEAKINRAIAGASAKIDDAFRGGRYSVPLSLDSNQTELVKHWASVLAGDIIFRSRRVAISGDEQAEIDSKVGLVMEEISKYQSGELKFSETPMCDGPTGPYGW